MKAFWHFISGLFLLVLSGFSTWLQAQDLTVASGTTYTVPSGQVQSFTHIYVSGELIVGNNATLNASGNISLASFSGGKVTMQENAKLNVAGNATLGNGNTLTINKGAKLVLSGVMDVTTGAVTLVESGTLEIKGRAIFKDGASFTSDKGSTVKVSGRDGQNRGLFIYNSSIFTVDNNSQVEVSGGDLLLDLSITAAVRQGGKIIARKGLITLASSLNVSQNGIIELYGNFTSTSATVTFNTGAELRLLGGNQTVNAVPALYNLVLGGSGNKSLAGTSAYTINNKLDLGSRLLVLTNTLTIASTAPDAIVRTTGYIVSGAVKRSIDAQSLNKIYLFPVGTAGTNGKYRPVQLKPVGASTGSYIVEYRGGAANSLSQKVDQVLAINNAYYHKIYREGNAPSADLTIFYDQGTEGPFNRITRWNTTLGKWEFLSGLGGTVPATPLLGVTARSVSLSTSNNNNPGTTLFVLARGDEKPFIPQTYGVLKRELDGGFYIAIQDTLRFRFEEEYATAPTASLTYTIYNKNHSPITSPGNLTEITGFNRFKVYIPSSSIAPGEFGMLEVQNKKGEKWYLKFKTKEF